MRLNHKLSGPDRDPMHRTVRAVLVASAALACVVVSTPAAPLEVAAVPVAVRTPLDASTTPVAARTPVPPTKPDPIAAAVATAAPAGPAQVGIAVLDRSTGKLTLGRLGAVPFLSASVVKLLTAVDVLRRAEVGAGTVSPAQRVLIQRALSASDDAAMGALWQQFGGARTVTEIAGWAHLRDTRAPGPTDQWAETKLSARDVVATYTYVLTTLNPVDRKLILDSLRGASPTGADGFDQSFGLLSPPRRPGVAAKQGWMTVGPAQYLHSTGLIGPGDRYVVAVLTKRPAADGFPAGRAAVSAAVARVLSALTLTPPPAGRPSSRPPAAHAPAPPAPHHVPYPQLRPSSRPPTRP